MKIKSVKGFQVLDSRGRPTVACSITLDDESIHSIRVPSGASTGKHEAQEVRDEGTPNAESFYQGRSVFGVVKRINDEIAPLLISKTISVESVDALLLDLDGKDQQNPLGSNATLAVSLAALKASAHADAFSIASYLSKIEGLLIPMPMVNILSGGAHALNSMDFQDILVIPNGSENFGEALSWIVAIREEAIIFGRQKGYVTHLVADEGGLGIPFENVEVALEFLVNCIERVGLKPKDQVSIAIDVAATQFFSENKYDLKNLNKSLNSHRFSEFLGHLIQNFPILSIEDPFAEDDWIAWQEFTKKYGSQLQIIGDDLFTTNIKRLERGINENAANAILIKPNQNGFITETSKVLNHAKANNFATVVSARSGETEDSWLADLAVGWRAGQIKVGSTHGSDRTSKWNRLLELEAYGQTVFSNPFVAIKEQTHQV